MTGKLPDPIEAIVQSGHPFFELIEEAYRVFAYPKPKSTEVCERCCMDPKIEADFFNPQIRNLPLSYVRDWYFAAYDPNGVAKETWAYLLPRILEILAAGEDVATFGIEVSLCRHDTGNPGNWSANEWSILDRFQREYLQTAIEQGSNSVDDVLCMFRRGGWPLHDLLDQVAAAPDANLAERFWRDWCHGLPQGDGSIWITAFWESHDNTAVFDFYTSPELYDRMEALALADDTDAERGAMASAVAGVIEASASRRRH